jgi:hypothetical protein
MTEAQDSIIPRQEEPVVLIRLLVGLAQGVALYLLYYTQDSHGWPATDGLLYAPILFVWLFVPLGILLGVSNIRTTTLALWIAAAAVLVAGLAWYDIWHTRPGEYPWLGEQGFAPDTDIVPHFACFFFTGVFLFIAHALIAGGDADRRVIARYTTYFDIAWKLALQLLLATVFVGIFWGLLWLGAALFALVKINAFQEFIEHSWFAIPASALATAMALHLTDVRAGLVRGTRTLVLILLAWLMPMMTAIVAAFLLTLIFTGLQPLWETRHAASLLLVAEGMLVILINAAYQDGESSRRPPWILRSAGTLACLLLLPLVLLSGYAIWLRVAQYGWTADRVASAACLTVALFYAFGYWAAAYPRTLWLNFVERWNFFAALVVLAVIVAVLSPLADPYRIAVDSQVARLESGKIAPDKFDFDYLRWRAGRYGYDALAQLVQHGSPEIRARAKATLSPKATPKPAVVPISPLLAKNLTVYPKGSALPASFLNEDWRESGTTRWIPLCLRFADYHCDAYQLDLYGDGGREIVVLETSGLSAAGSIPSGDALLGAVFAPDPDGWHVVAKPGAAWACKALIEALRGGTFTYDPPPAQRLRDVVVGTARLRIVPYETELPCPK